MLSQEGVMEVHHIHIWALSSNINALTAHVKVNAADNAAANHIRENIRKHSAGKTRFSILLWNWR